MKQPNPIDLAIIKLACVENHIIDRKDGRFWIIDKPEQQLLEILDGAYSLLQIRERIRQLKTHKGKLIATKSTSNGTKYTQLYVSERLFIKINGYCPHINESQEDTKPVATKNEQAQNAIAPKDRKSLIYIAVDYENLVFGEMQLKTNISFYKLKEYIRQFGVIKEAKIFWPLKYLDRNRMRELTHLSSTEGGVWQVIVCGQTTKDKDQVDSHIAQCVRDQCYYHPDMEIWIISRDSDFLALVEQSKDRGCNNIKLIDPFQIPEILGSDTRGESQGLSRHTQSILDLIQIIPALPKEKEHSTSKLIRYSAGFVLLESNQDAHENYDSLYGRLREFLHHHCRTEFNCEPGFHKNVIRAFREVGIVTQIGRGSNCQIIINSDHSDLSRLAPPHFVNALAKLNGFGKITEEPKASNIAVAV